MLLLAVLALLTSSLTAGAQPTICQDVDPTNMISDFASWHWEVDRNDPTYCNTWAIRTGGNTKGKVYGAPWLHAQNGVLARIAADKDYTPAAGWVLLRMDLGGKTVVNIPYFILYNKYTSMIRSYFWLNNSAGTYNNGAVITLSHSSISRTSPATSLAQTPALAPDQYLANRKANEVISYVAKMSSQDGWIVGEFTPAFDPYFRDDAYQGSQLQFDVYGIVTNNVSLAGDVNFKTNTEEGFSIAGDQNTVIKPKTDASGTSLKEFFTAGSTILGAVKPEDADKFLGNIHDAGLSLAKAKNPATSNTGLSIANATRPAAAGGGLRSTLGKVLGVASNVSSIFGVVGTLIGAFFPEDSSPAGPPPFTPTVSKGSIALSGTITTTFPLRGVVCQIPGTKHSSDLSTAPYYDAALGLFNIKHPLVLNKKSYVHTYAYTYATSVCSDNTNYYNEDIGYDSYQVQNDLEGVYNKAAGFELVSAEAALVSEISADNSFLSADVSTPYFFEGDDCSSRSYSTYVGFEVQSGVLEQTKISETRGVPGIVQTPFVPFGCIRNLAFTTYKGEKVYLRVKVVLKSTDTTRPQPLVYYVQDYAVNVNDNATPTNPAFSNGNIEPPFTNLPVALSSLPNALTVSGQFTSPVTKQALSSLQTSNTTTFTHTGSTPSQLLAGNEISLQPGFGVAPETNFVAALGLASQRTCGNSLITANTEPWAYNSSAYRLALASTPAVPATPDAAPGLVVFPNPTTGDFSVTVHGYTGPASLLLLNSIGQVQLSRTIQLSGSTAEQISAGSLAKGVYILRLTTTQGVLTQKLVLR